MKDYQFIHTYKLHKGQKRPVITTALKLDRAQDGTIMGLAVGFSYCSTDDQPNKKIGRMIAMGRAKNVIQHVRTLEKSVGVDGGIATGFRTKYGPDQIAENENGEAYETGHPHNAYVPLPVDEKILECVPIPDEQHVVDRIVLALSNVQKFGQL